MLPSPAAAAKRRSSELVVERLQIAPASGFTSTNGTGMEDGASDARRGVHAAGSAARREQAAPAAETPSDEPLGVAGTAQAGTTPQNGAGAVATATSTDGLLPLNKKKKLRLLEKADTGRPLAQVIRSTPVGAVKVALAPKLSDFRLMAATSAEREALLAAAMQKWMKTNVSARAIEQATQVCKG